jgi:ApeA N-terminal domain 1
VDQLIADTLAGSVAYVWPFFGADDWERRQYAGHIARSDNRVKLSVLAPLPLGDGLGSLEAQKHIPESVLAVSTIGSTLAFDITRMSGTTHIGGSKASNRDYYSRAVAVGFPAEDLQSSRMYEMAAYFPGLEHWSNITGSTAESNYDEYHRPTEITLKIKAAPDEIARLSDSHIISVSTHFEVSGPADDQQVYTPLSISSTTDEPADWWEHLLVMTRIQDLISLCWDGYPLADGGYVRLDLHDASSTANAKLWSERLMEVPDAVRQAGPSSSFPQVRYETLGGVDAFARWIEVAGTHPRAVVPLISRHRVARSAATQSKLLDICAAIGYWVDFHARQKHGWTAKNSKKDTKAGALARQVGRHFESFVGDAAKWSRLLSDRYDELRHDPTIQHDNRELGLLVESARILLTAALLNEVSRDDAPSRSLCAASDNYMIGYEIRADLTGSGACVVPTDDSILHTEGD